ncbi:MAG: glycosyltransferase family 2 protein [Nocardioides sp.]|uniref:glycosyltransferase n=1 Tax=Nocardioides sp. TaxID=35761 RepID=UPI0039E56837
MVDPTQVITAAAAPPRLRRPREIVAVLEPVLAAPDDASASIPADPDAVQEAATRLTRHLRAGEVVAATDDGRLSMRLRHDDTAARPVRLQEMAYHAMEVLDDVTDLGVGWAPITRKQDAVEAGEHAAVAAEDSLAQRDLQPRQAGHHLRRRTPRISRWTAGHQILLATIGSIVLPFLALVGLYAVGLDVSGVLYWIIVAAFGITSLSIWAECSHAFDPPRLPEADPDTPAPPATAVIAAYLPNEADTIVETVHSFLAQDYEPGLQVLLAYNTPVELPVQAELAELAERHERLTVLEVPDSTSKAQNVNAALRVATGEVVGIFDADHHPMPGAFARAWRWIHDGADVVQGHCVIRNGEDSGLARLVAVEFEQIYAVAHPGRAALHGFGIFGGSNGYWRASALERIRLRGSFLTEDIEASIRVLAAGGRIVNDPGLVSRELAPETVKALWRQRMRWAQGWFQVSIRHLGAVLRSPHLGLRQKLGATYLLGWRELYPWISILTWPLIGFLAWRDGGLDMSSPLFGLIALFVTASGPIQTLAAYRLATPELRRHPWWFVRAAILNLLVYTEAKNLVNRVAHLKQLRGEHQWVVTPRTAQSAGSTESDPVLEEVAA